MGGRNEMNMKEELNKGEILMIVDLMENENKWLGKQTKKIQKGTSRKESKKWAKGYFAGCNEYSADFKKYIKEWGEKMNKKITFHPREIIFL